MQAWTGVVDVCSKAHMGSLVCVPSSPWDFAVCIVPIPAWL